MGDCRTVGPATFLPGGAPALPLLLQEAFSFCIPSKRTRASSVPGAVLGPGTTVSNVVTAPPLELPADQGAPTHVLGGPDATGRLDPAGRSEGPSPDTHLEGPRAWELQAEGTAGGGGGWQPLPPQRLPLSPPSPLCTQQPAPQSPNTHFLLSTPVPRQERVTCDDRYRKRFLHQASVLICASSKPCVSHIKNMQ